MFPYWRFESWVKWKKWKSLTRSFWVISMRYWKDSKSTRMTDDPEYDEMVFYEVCAKRIWRDTVLAVYVDETYLILLCFTRNHQLSYHERTIAVRCVETFAIVRTVSIPFSTYFCLESFSSDYANGLFVTTFPDEKSYTCFFKWLFLFLNSMRNAN